ncbi:MAG TPA: VWA domain-containing protein [Pyrinomonadaceae bacterium]|jgi:Ca-activated chloride channel family protein|nr:VWA domain-containing protein [Pyrinomonadaceae bacterium]
MNLVSSARYILVCGVLLIAVLLCSPQPVTAQDDDDVVRVNTDLVLLNVTVTDKAGQYVRALKAADFKVYEDGIEVPPKSIVSFDVQESPYAAVVLLDSSGSMETRFSLARSAAIRFLDGLREEDVAAVYRFDSTVERIQEFSGGRDLAPIGYAVRAKGMTTLHDAIVQAAKVLADRPEKRKAIVILSDGMDTFSKATSGKAIDSALAVGASIFAVDMAAVDTPGYSNRQSALSLKGFAEKTGGRFVSTPGGQALRDAFTGIADELGHQYTIAYRPTNTTRDGKWKTLEVKVNREDVVVRTRKGYRSPKR